MAEIIVTGKVVIFDDEDAELVNRHSWFLNTHGYACTALRVAPGKKGRRTIGMHRLILGDPDSKHVDHINRNKLDNRRTNLRPCSISENNRNIGIRPNKASKYRGVSRLRNRWQVMLRINGELQWFGSYATEEEAAMVAAPHFEGIAP